MVITYHGGECFKVVFGDTTLAFNPPSKSSRLKSARFGADIALSTMNHPDFNGGDEVSFGEKKPFVISGPGEYEVKKVTVEGAGVETIYDGKLRVNTIYVVNLEGMNLCFLGALSSRKLSPEAKELLDDIDILFVPIGGGDVLTPADAHECAVELEPRLVIPMHYSTDNSFGSRDALSRFLKEEGASGSPVDKLTIKKKDVAEMGGEIVVLAS